MLIPITTGSTDFPITLRQLLTNLEKMTTTHPDYLDYPLKFTPGKPIIEADLVAHDRGPFIQIIP